jgi:hypothetical protein
MGIASATTGGYGQTRAPFAGITPARAAHGEAEADEEQS